MMPFKAAGTGKNMFDSEYFLKTPRKRDCISKEKEVQKQEGSSGGEKGLKEQWERWRGLRQKRLIGESV